jgi:hypothetical protein
MVLGHSVWRDILRLIFTIHQDGGREAAVRSPSILHSIVSIHPDGGMQTSIEAIVKQAIRTSIARTVLEDICYKPIRIQSYCAVARLHGVSEKDTEDLLREISELIVLGAE